MVVSLATFCRPFCRPFCRLLHNLYNDVRATYRRPYDVEFNDVFLASLNDVQYTIYNEVVE